MNINYRSVADLNADMVSWLGTLPRDIELIAGIPRSGLLAANLLALHLNLPMTDIDGLLEGRLLSAGARLRQRELGGFLTVKRKILVVDDSVLGGLQMQAVKERIRAAKLPHDVLFAAVYVAPGARKHVDLYCDVVAPPRCFEWNFMHHELFLSHTCMDIDGVLCHDPSESENDDGPRYLNFLASAEPLYLPTYPVGWLVTSRLEKYRRQTEEWLARHGVRYGELIMMDYPDMAARRRANAYARFKADAYLRTRAWLFVESSLSQATEIAELTGYRVLCMETRQMVMPGRSSALRRAVLDAPREAGLRIEAAGQRAVDLGRAVYRRLMSIRSRPSRSFG